MNATVGAVSDVVGHGDFVQIVQVSEDPNLQAPPVVSGDNTTHATSRSCQIQLWQFLLELLTDYHYQDVIRWTGEGSEFILLRPETVAQMWGHRKGNGAMNYDKLARALRYYYEADMIAKVPEKRFVYKFVCDLKTVLGYSAAELNALVTECSEQYENRILPICIIRAV